METVVLSIHIVLAVCLVVLVLLQQGKGADVGAVMGGGANSLFGVSGASNLLVKMTTSVAVAFMLTSVLLVRFAAGRAGAGRPIDDPLRGSSLGGAIAAVETVAPSVTATTETSAVPAALPPAEGNPQAVTVPSVVPSVSGNTESTTKK